MGSNISGSNHGHDVPVTKRTDDVVGENDRRLRMKARGRPYLVLAAIFGIVGIVQCIRWGMSGFGLAVGACMLNLLLMVGCVIAYALSRRTRRKNVQALIGLLCLAVFLTWGLLTLAGGSLIAATTEVTNTRKYEQILAEYWIFNPDIVGHFPRPIPSNAKDVRFSYLPGFLQGGAHVQLRYSTSPDAIAELYRHCSARKTKSFRGGEITDMPVSPFYTSGSQDLSFPNDYEIMVFDALPKEGEPQNWNHGQSHGVAISTQRNEIVYWAESW